MPAPACPSPRPSFNSNRAFCRQVWILFNLGCLCAWTLILLPASAAAADADADMTNTNSTATATATANAGAGADTGASGNIHSHTNTAAPSDAPPLPDFSDSIVRVVGALALVLALFFGGVWLFKNWQRFAPHPVKASRLHVLEHKSLGHRQTLVVVRYQQEHLLLASSPAGVTLLSHLPPPDENHPDPAPAKSSFAQTWQQMLHRPS